MDIALGDLNLSHTLGKYYLDYSAIIPEVERGLYGPFSPEGIPLVDYDRLFRGHPAADPRRRYGTHYTPVTSAEYALALWSRFISRGDQDAQARFERQAERLLKELFILRRDFGVWLHQFEFPMYRLSPPWVSAMAQGYGISVLLRAYQSTGARQYLESAECAAGAFTREIKDGGVCTYDTLGDLWLEEFPTNPPVRVLNGFIFALWGALDLFRVTNNDTVRIIWESGVQTIARNLQRYERLYWSQYDLVSGIIASRDYHRIHLLQLEALWRQTNVPIFQQFADRWQEFAGGKCGLRRWMARKTLGTLRRLRLLPRKSVSGVRFLAQNCS